MSPSLAAIASTLKDLRLELGLSPEELADLAGLPAETVNRYEEDPHTLSSEVALQALEALFPPDEDDDEDDDEEEDDDFEEAAGFEEDDEGDDEDEDDYEDDDDDADDTGGFGPSGPPQELFDEWEAKMRELEAAQRIDEGRFRDALDCLELSLRLTSLPEPNGRVLLTKAAVLSQIGRELRALDTLREAERRLAVRKKPTLWMRLRLEQLHVLCALERYAEAEAWLEEARELAGSVGYDWHRLQVRCLHGWIAAGLGRNDEALEVFRPLRPDLMAAKRLFEATGIGLDMAGLLAARGDADGVRELADELEPLLEDKRIPVPARTPLKLFCWAVRRGHFRAERGPKLAMEFRKEGGRLSRPYELPF